MARANERDLLPFTAPFAEDDVAIARRLLSAPPLPTEAESAISGVGRALVAAVRDRRGLGDVEAILHEYALSTKEGLALMVLAEALLRVPDAATADRLIEDKLGLEEFIHHQTRSDALLATASAWALGLAARIIQAGETPEGILAPVARRIGLPALRAATREAMRVIGNHFVFGQTIEAALERAADAPRYRYSFDMLGEGARTAADAARYLEAYRVAIAAIGKSAGNTKLPDRPGISVKLSALHPRYEAISRKRVLDEIVPALLDLARAARSHELNFTVDAEEADRLELSLEVIAAVLSDPSLKGWDGFGLAIQAYQKRAEAVVDWTIALAERLDRRMMVRLVKGAYWDTEIKRAQERGIADYPVFTRKAMTDLNFVVCAKKLLAARPRLFPQFATHNALTVATMLPLGGDGGGFEFQRLHGMGEALYADLLEKRPDLACRTYAPVGSHRDLLAYLVRRLIENGANSSFVAAAADDSIPVETLLQRPETIIGKPEKARHRGVPLPRDLFAPERVNSRGVELGHRQSLEALLSEVRQGAPVQKAVPLVDGEERQGKTRGVVSPIDASTIAGHVAEADGATVEAAMRSAVAAFPAWSNKPPASRAAALVRAGDLLEERRGQFIALLQNEGGKTLDDAVSEVREAADFCRYYAAEGLKLLGESRPLPGPTGESNALSLRGRGVFVAISPWNFPMAIFTGQIAAALMAGNAVVAKPAEQTPLVAAAAVRLLHEAGVAASALALVPGDGGVGAALVAHPAVDGVVFTGSTEVARSINRVLAAKDGPIVPLIAETGGINAMIADATALPEQVTDDVMTSAFRSAGQRCSALRLLCVQEDVADAMIAMVAGAARELKVGDPRDPATHVGPVIDSEAWERLTSYVEVRKKSARLHYAGRAPERGYYIAPRVIELKAAAELTEEVFGPILHVVRYRADRLDALLDQIDAMGYGLTLGVHSRIDATIDQIVRRMRTGNVYVNRSMIGAVVGSQPFGGHRLSGTGPKAGGPHYLARFAAEQTVTVNTAAAGGNASLFTVAE
jgi:RHH-type proline utilization regulon transcriptional repressor/proline dehydrogenase/delta 1-pyrroline-5-carboxylate dehydrogenase